MMPDRTKAPEIKPFGHLSIPPENVELLSNGITLHSYRGGDQPVCRISVMIPFDAGSESNPAVLRMLPQMLTEGCAAYTADQLDEFFDFKGVRIGGRASAHFHILEAGFLADSGSDVIDILGAILSSPSFDKQRLETIRQRNIASYLTSASASYSGWRGADPTNLRSRPSACPAR
ncbi:MAG: hypothetical protein K2F63_06995 [Muribaculaceae bacterium]|nr:hypothetical protein [Muribaculaceae bacterium]